MKYEITHTHRFKKSLKNLKRSGNFDMEKYYLIADMISKGGKLPDKNQDHSLTGDYLGFRECHIEYDILLIYKISGEEKAVSFSDIGSHTYLFGM